MMNSGIIAIDKPKDWTSFDVVNKIKHMVKPFKVGHLGTLDPMATGVLLITVGKATRLFDLMQEKRKTYIATFEFGQTTDTLDSTGEIVATSEIIPSREDIESVLPKFIGSIDQIPPKYSAKSINGKRAYDLARQNIDFELKPKRVEIYNIAIKGYVNRQLTLEIECGSGTYIRSIGRDIASELKTVAVMTSLVRTSIDQINLDECLKIDELNKDNISTKLISLNEILDYPILEISALDRAKILNGQTKIIDQQDGVYKLVDDN
ncbi:MAG: tRNA pseudouridine(55) synthase TruB, partial [Clostridia bacterium]